ncbi:MAG TPA: 3-phosphoshikimate 1-carboxyvinyltransferase [Flavobacterium sp.]|jgi:3-phosphoshikimate 1-carboxyvinyltransferase
MDILLKASELSPTASVRISGSKSETNRALLLQALYPEIELQNMSDSEDSLLMAAALASSDREIDIGHAGTAMRFLTAYFASQPNREVTLKGSARMHERPIKILVDALLQIGADIQYLAKDGFPPLQITGRELARKVTIDANVSSQYVSALILIGPKLPHGIEINLSNEITSGPYIRMTLRLLNEIGIDTGFDGRKISIGPHATIQNPQLTIESDWSSASYYYSIVALSKIGTGIRLNSFNADSIQGDSALKQIYESFGVETQQQENTIILEKVQDPNLNTKLFILDLKNTPDLAQTIAVTCFGLGIACHFTGLQTLKIKETDRLAALKAELTKLGATVTVTSDSLTLEASGQVLPSVSIKTYGDHRMAMAFAPLAIKVPIIIKNAEVVSKSYPAFWTDLRSIGFIPSAL